MWRKAGEANTIGSPKPAAVPTDIIVTKTGSPKPAGTLTGSPKPAGTSTHIAAGSPKLLPVTVSPNDAVVSTTGKSCGSPIGNGSPIANVLSTWTDDTLSTTTSNPKKKDVRAKPKLTDKQRLYLISFLSKFRNEDGKLQTGAIKNAAGIYDTTIQTVYKIWKRYTNTCDEYGLGGNFQRNYTKVGRKKVDRPGLLNDELCSESAYDSTRQNRG